MKTDKYVIKFSKDIGGKEWKGYVTRFNKSHGFDMIPWISDAPQYSSKVADQRLERLRSDENNRGTVFEKVAVSC